MKAAKLSIKRKIMTVTMLTSVIVLIVAVGAFLTYDLAHLPRVDAPEHHHARASHRRKQHRGARLQQ